MVPNREPEAKDELVRLEESLSDSIASTVAGAFQRQQWPDPEELRGVMEKAMEDGVVRALEHMAEAYANKAVGAERYERGPGRRTRRSGSRSRKVYLWQKIVRISYPKLRRGPSVPPVLQLLSSRPKAVKDTFARLWLRGMSTRDLERESKELAGHQLSHQAVAEDLREMQREALRWQNRPVEREFRYLLLDALYTSVYRTSKASKEAIHLALGITEDGKKEVLSVFVAPQESKESWTTVLKRLQLRGLNTDKLRLVATDGNEGLLAALKAELPKVRRQRCTLHRIRNVVGRAPRGKKRAMGQEVARIFKAPSRSEAEARLKEFVNKWEHEHPRAVAPMQEDMDAAFAYYDFPPALWKSLRTTNALERVNREFRRKLREVGTLKGEAAAERTTVSIAKMLNEQWRDAPIKGFRNH
jgi:putative transposase